MKEEPEEDEEYEDYPEERPGVALPVMAAIGIAMLALGVFIAWLLSGPDLKRSEEVDEPPSTMTSTTPEPGQGLEVRRAEIVSNETVARAIPVNDPAAGSLEVRRALPVDGAPVGELAVSSEPVVTTPTSVDVRLEAGENIAVQREVLRRIDAMPNLTNDSKDKLYAHVNRARGMGRLATIHFGAGQSRPAPDAVAELRKVFATTDVLPLAQDPTVAFVVLGYADSTGDPAKNLAISMERAESVVNALRNELQLQNISHAVGMGGTDFLDPAQAGKNRAVEVWAVLP